MSVLGEWSVWMFHEKIEVVWSVLIFIVDLIKWQ